LPDPSLDEEGHCAAAEGKRRAAGWKRKITGAFMSRYFASARDSGETRGFLRLRTATIFPGFDSAPPEEKEAYLAAAMALERKKVARLRWEEKGRGGGGGRRLKTISCDSFERLFRAAGQPFPRTEAERTRAMLASKLSSLKEALAGLEGEREEAEKVVALLEFLSERFGLREIGQGLNRKIMEDLVLLLEFHFKPAQLEKITPRALSILLYQDSKHLEALPAFCSQFFARLQKDIPVPDIAFMLRSYPETLISGKISIRYKEPQAPLVNARGHILGMPLQTAEKVSAIRPARLWPRSRTALIVENKETFYALGSPQKHGAARHLRYDCYLYAGGYPNRAVAALVKTLASSGFALHYAGDMDPDGILILQSLCDFAGRPVAPVKMSAAAFDKYRPWARTLTKAMIGQMERVREDTKALPGISGLIARIEETGLGVEQEIVDYREP